MSKKTDIKTCRYTNCKHESTNIDITKDEYRTVGNFYYHPDCLKAKRNGEWKDEQTKKDLQYIKNGWLLHISNTVVYSQLFRCLNDLISRGVSSEYLVFVFDYVVKNKMPLRYPNGFKYFVDNQGIKDAYNKQQKAKLHTKEGVFVVGDDDTDEKLISVKKRRGFECVLGGR